MKVILINSVPINTGDEALLLGTINALDQKHAYYELEVWTNNLELANKNTTNIDLYHDLEYHIFDRSKWINLAKRALFKFKFFRLYIYLKFLQSKNERLAIEKLGQADMILSSAGGYFTDYYNCSDRLTTLNIINSLGKKIILLPQSFGPFWKKRSIEQLKYTLANIPQIYTRESISTDMLQSIGINHSISCPDLAFNLPTVHKSRDTSTLDIIMNFRGRKKDALEDQSYTKAISIITYLLSKKKVTITLVSTCQGIEGYVDDSTLSQRIKANFKNDPRVKVTGQRLDYQSYRDYIQDYDLYIGMRLHGALLSMLSNIPAFCIGYEHKSVGIYTDMGIEEDQCPIQESEQVLINRISNFIENRDNRKASLQSLIDIEVEKLKQSLIL